MKKKQKIPINLIPYFRTNHAGETGAVYIYKAIILVSSDKDVLNFAKNHLKTESEHLSIIEDLLEKQHRSKLIFLWKVAGFLTGFIPSIISKKFIFSTIFYVENFVESHYQEQIEMLNSNPSQLRLQKVLKRLQDDEVSHKDEAKLEVTNFSLIHKMWGRIVESGSTFAVKISMHI